MRWKALAEIYTMHSFRYPHTVFSADTATARRLQQLVVTVERSGEGAVEFLESGAGIASISILVRITFTRFGW